MEAGSVQSLMALAIGFGVAGAVASGYRLWAERPLGFELMAESQRRVALTAVPMLVFAAPFIIMRNTIRGRRLERRRVSAVAAATVIAGLWSLMSGTVVAAGWIALVAALG